jgi:hypothetical protein
MLVDLRQLQSRINALPLFQRVGCPIGDLGNPDIHQWDAWVGPEEPGSLAIAVRQQDLHDELVTPEDEQEWLSALQLVVDHSATLIPYDPNADVWNAPTAAAWNAAWSLVLEHLHIARKIAVPADLSAQLSWYERGHWPSSLIEERSGANAADYVIF